MGRLAAALASGILFGAGLALSHMTDPAVVLAFLDVAGDWDPRLAFVMAGALAATAPGYRLLFARGRPWLAPRFELPARRDIDARLVLGAALFGVGWGLAGFCPGPALAAFAAPSAGVAVFAAGLLGGTLLGRRIAAPRGAAP
jgi:uncharacterized membrane protein YedE/YeeE